MSLALTTPFSACVMPTCAHAYISNRHCQAPMPWVLGRPFESRKSYTGLLACIRFHTWRTCSSSVRGVSIQDMRRMTDGDQEEKLIFTATPPCTPQLLLLAPTKQRRLS